MGAGVLTTEIRVNRISHSIDAAFIKDLFTENFQNHDQLGLTQRPEGS